MASCSKMPSCRLVRWAATGLAFVSCVLLIVFVALAARDLAPMHAGPEAVAVAATVFEAISLLLFAAMAWRETSVSIPATVFDQQRLRSRRLMDVIANSATLAVGSALSLATAGLIGSQVSSLQTLAGLSPGALLAGIVASVALTVVFESTALILLVLDSRESSSIVVLPPAEVIEARAHWSDGEGTTAAPAPAFVLSKDPPKTADSSSISFRSSLTASTRPGSSKNPPGSSRPSSSSQSSQFDTWDTSGVPPPLRDTVHSRVQPYLPPIPGSRPASPAKALDGPFLPDSPHPSQVAMDLHTPGMIDMPSPAIGSDLFYSPPTSPDPNARPPLKSSASLESIPRPYLAPPPVPDSGDAVPLPRTYSQTSLADSVSHLSSRRVIKIPSEEHIHPLFRASSATPPPSASLGTIVTAATIEDALGKRRTASAEALRGRPPVDRVASTRSARSNSARSQKRAKAELNNALAAQSLRLVEGEEPPSPERNPPPVPTRSALRTASPSPMPELEPEALPELDESIPDYMVAATSDPQFAAFNRAASLKR